jgi:phosphatidate cytidylyltransferase
LRSTLLIRTLSTLVALPIIIGFVWAGGWWFGGILAVVTAIATWEYVRMLAHLALRPSYPFAIALLLLLLLFFLRGDSGYLQPVLACILVASLAWHVLYDRSDTRMQNWLLPLAGALYIGWLGGHMLLLRGLDRGAYRLFATLAITWIADSGAYLVGSKWGKRLLAPQISPSKTWEGYLGGTALACLGGLLFLGLRGLGWIHGLLLGLVLGALTPLGDLGISMIKRQARVKDTGRLLPGHGGALDRLDSVFIAAAIGYYYQIWAMGAALAG